MRPRIKVVDVPLTTIERFASKFVIVDSGCWEWSSPLDIGGYGSFSNGRAKNYKAHRWFYQIFYNVRLSDVEVCDHLCRNRKCVNPKHIDIVDSRTNVLRGDTIPAKNLSKTRCKHGHALSGDNLHVNKKGHRHCVVCTRYLDRVRHGMTKEAAFSLMNEEHRLNITSIYKKQLSKEGKQ